MPSLVFHFLSLPYVYYEVTSPFLHMFHPSTRGQPTMYRTLGNSEPNYIFPPLGHSLGYFGCSHIETANIEL